ncbi:hypothetical protein FDJ57_gp65 [Gordonia phage Sour]|uniref:Uncharacterized protein n=1 Tax=Gordonia phage Sour TaxID=2182349 RepID=A0A2U8ULF1_9CAUD|nr:hypothetical protein FDJ57_gp65 [Gordonia phage Sour]AWN04266.1 hypothetical protein PBI_SOUR_65 [Gordonia phage Sour]
MSERRPMTPTTTPAREAQLAEPMEHRMRLVEHHSITVGTFDARIIGEASEEWMRDVAAPAVALARRWADEQGIDIEPHITERREGGSDDAVISVTWDVVVGSGRIRHDPDRFIDGGSRFLWSARWRHWLNRFMGNHVCSEIAQETRAERCPACEAHVDSLTHQTDCPSRPRCGSTIHNAFGLHRCDHAQGHPGGHRSARGQHWS